jgi:nucleoside-triphosphatase
MKILLEGRPAVGKTTVARRLAELLRDRRVTLAGFTTEEIRESGGRVGFAVETFDGGRATLAHLEFDAGPRVGRYRVDLDAFERIALPALEERPTDALVLIDELGKMELASERFRASVSELFESHARIVATVHVARHPFTDALKRRSDVETERVTHGNRDELPVRLAGRIVGG